MKAPWYFCVGAQSSFALSSSAGSAHQTRGDVFHCLSAKDVPSIAPSLDSSWQNLAPNYNLRLRYTPNVVVIPSNVDTAQQISNALICAKKFGLKVQAMSGSHSYASYSLGGQDGSMTISLLDLQDVEVDTTSGIARVGAGIRLGNLELALSNYSRALSHGTGADVGIGGHFTHGGYGYTSRAWGLAQDQIVALDVVTADGSWVHATETTAPELYYALRGAADSFGIVYNFYLKTQPRPSAVVYFSLDLPAAGTDLDSAVSSTLHLQSMIHNASVTDRNIAFGMIVTPGNYSVRGTYLGGISAFNATILPEMLRGLPAYRTTTSVVSEMTWLDSLTVLAGGPLNVSTTKPYKGHGNFFAKSVTVPEPGLTAAALRCYFGYIHDQGSSIPVDWFSIINLEGGADSQIKARSGDFAAYGHRDTTWAAQHYGSVDGDGDFPQAGLDFVGGLNEAMMREMPTTEFGAYINYADPSLGRDEANLKYFGSVLYERLRGYKVMLDPNELFWNPQSIPASAQVAST